jgi:hypothetical protein
VRKLIVFSCVAMSTACSLLSVAPDPFPSPGRPACNAGERDADLLGVGVFAGVTVLTFLGAYALSSYYSAVTPTTLAPTLAPLGVVALYGVSAGVGSVRVGQCEDELALDRQRRTVLERDKAAAGSEGHACQPSGSHEWTCNPGLSCRGVICQPH